MLNEEQLKKVFEEMAFSKSEIDVLIDETKVDEHPAIIDGWDKRYSDVVAKKPEVKEFYEKQFKDEGFNKSKEAIRKARKKINTDLALGLTAKELDDLTDDEFSVKVKEHSAKDTDTKLKDIQDQLAEEKRLRELAESTKDEEINKVKIEFKAKDVTRAFELKKANLIAERDSTKFNKSNMKLIDNAIKGAIINDGVDFEIGDDGVLYVMKNGQKMRDKSNNFVKAEDYVNPILDDFNIKGRETPRIDPVTGKPIEENVVELDENSKRLMKMYEAKGIKTGLEVPV